MQSQKRSIDTLVIYAEMNVVTKESNILGSSEESQKGKTPLDGILALNPMRVVLIGKGELPKQLSSKWQMNKASSLKEALEEKATLRQYFPCKEWHLFQLVSPTKLVANGTTNRSAKGNIYTLHG